MSLLGREALSESADGRGEWQVEPSWLAREQSRSSRQPHVRVASFDPISCSFRRPGLPEHESVDVECHLKETAANLRHGRKIFAKGVGQVAAAMVGGGGPESPNPGDRLHKHWNEFTQFPQDSDMKDIVSQHGLHDMRDLDEKALESYRRARERDIQRGLGRVDPIRWVDTFTGSPLPPVDSSSRRQGYTGDAGSTETAASLITYSASLSNGEGAPTSGRRSARRQDPSQIAELLAYEGANQENMSWTGNVGTAALSPPLTPVGVLLTDRGYTDDALDVDLRARLSPLPSGRRRIEPRESQAKDLIVPISKGERRILNARQGREVSRAGAFAFPLT